MPTKVIVQPTSTTVTVNVPDPEMSFNPATGVMTATQPPITQSGGTPIAPPDNKPVVFAVKQNNSPTKYPGASANQFFGGNGSQTNLPGTSSFETMDNDQRWFMKEIVTAPDTYNFKSIDAAINKCISLGQKLSFRITAVDSGQMAFPSFIPSLATNQPDFNSELYLSTVEKMAAVLAKHLKDTGLINYIYKIDMGGIGNYSEMHWFGLTVPVITAANGKRIISAWTTNFPDKPLMITISALTNNSSLGKDLAMALLNASNNFGPVGIRCDHFGSIDKFNFDMDASKYWDPSMLQAVLNRYKTSPVCGELMNNLGEINPSNPYSDLPGQIKQLGASQFSNNNFCRLSSSGASSAQITASDNNIRAASMLAGARISITGGNYIAGAGSLILTLDWLNKGGMPLYENYVVTITIGGVSVVSKVSLRGMMGVVSFTDTITGIPPGTYTVTVDVREAQRGALPMGFTGALVSAVVIL